MKPMKRRAGPLSAGILAGLAAAAGILAAAVLIAGKPAAPVPDPAADYIVRLRDDGEASSRTAVRTTVRTVGGDVLAALLEEDAVLWYEEDAEIPLLPEENGGSVYFESYQWNLAMIGAEAAFDRNAAGQGIRVGVLDSGVNPHPALGARLLPGHNYIEGAKNPDDTSDEFGHGTKVAGLIAGAGDQGCIGAAPLAEIVPLKCADGQTVRVSALCRAIYGGIDDYGCRVLNLSMGIQTEQRALAEAVAYAAEKNVILVAGVGNGGGKQLYYPAAYDTVIGVGAVDRNGSWYERSNHNAGVFLTAPGVEVRTTDHRGGYSLATGCSFAVPQVSAAAAVLLSADGSLTAGEILEHLRSAAAGIGGGEWDEYYGYGILDLGRAVERVLGPAPDAASPWETDPAWILPPSDGRTEARAAGESSGFYDVGSDPAISAEPYSTATGAVAPVLRDTDGLPGQETFWPASDAVRVTVPFTVKGQPYLLRLLDGDGTVLFAEQKEGGGLLTFAVVPPLPEKPASLRLILSSGAERFTPAEIPLRYTPAAAEIPAGRNDSCPKDASCPLRRFSDLDPALWYHDGIHAALDGKILNGYDDGTFRPGAPTSRAMIVTMLWRAEGEPQIRYALRFADVPEDAWYAGAVRWAVSAGIVSGYSETAFGPDDGVTREQLAAILYRYAGGNTGSGAGDDPLGNFPDAAKLSPWAADAMRWALNRGLFNGTERGTLDPGGNATRAQVAAVLSRLRGLGN